MWSECQLLDISLTGALVELAGDVPDGPVCDLPFALQIDSIAEDDVGVTMRARVLAVECRDADMIVAEIEFDARREERLLLHLLVRLHTLV
jgi:hypothetical protein